MLTLYGCKGCGSAVVEAVLDVLGLPFERVMLDWDDRAAWTALEKWNPLMQVPALVADDGAVITESAAIVFWLLHRHPGSTLMPDAPADQAAMFRWIAFLANNLYAAIIIGDFPERWTQGGDAQQALKEGSLERAKVFWKMFEANAGPATHLAGSRLSALDLYAAMLSRWRPGRKWLDENCPRAMSAVRLAEKDPRIAAAWARNFDPL